jgi:hypothetical protein
MEEHTRAGTYQFLAHIFCTVVKLSFIEQLKVMGWQHIAGDVDVPDFTERRSLRAVLHRGIPKSGFLILESRL